MRQEAVSGVRTLLRRWKKPRYTSMLVDKTVKYTTAAPVVVLNAPIIEVAFDGCENSVRAIEPNAITHIPRKTWKELSHSAL